ncbi:ComEA family DNA-binding protein [uncultured Megasphaera sp.]|uniref:ComEA family DNA-binding protein n=1 Tax=Megasphaera massiliensis TaxID=1232428 RepID=UPI00266C2503|nr:ComEA family DNA-binding protein [uncultured Megasphaera sp.]
MKKIVVFGAIAVFFALSQFSEHLFPVVAEPVPVVEEVLPDKAFIYVTGAVHRPGLYALAGEQTVGEAVETAGGMAAYADTTAVNLAERAADGMHVHIPYDWNGVPPAPIDEGKVSLNQADAEKLMTLPGIGPAMADNIIAYRREHGAFTSIDELQKVKGIGPAKFQKLKDQVGL